MYYKCEEKLALYVAVVGKRIGLLHTEKKWQSKGKTHQELYGKHVGTLEQGN